MHRGVRMKLYGALAGVLALTWAVSSPAVEPWEAFLDQVRIKKAISDNLTPEELQARKERLAQFMYQQHLLGGRTPGDVCTAATGETTLGPFNDTTIGAVDNFDLPADTAAPTCTAPSTCTGAGPAGSLPRGAVYTGTGTGPDRAFKIRSSTACQMVITMTPTGGQDLALIAYQSACTSNLADCACVDDTGVANTAESVTLDMAAGTEYFVVTDGYSTTATPPGPSGPYTMQFSGAGCTLVGDGTFNYTATPATLNFSGAVGAPTPTQDVSVAAAGGNTGALTIQSCAFSGANAADFAFNPAPTFPISVAAGATSLLPVRMTAGAAGARTATLTCQVPNATAPSATSFAVTLNGTASSDVNPTLTYVPATGSTINFPAGAPGTATSTINITSAGAVGAGATTVSGCAFTGGTPASFGVATTPANGVFNTGTTTGSIDLTCTRGASAVSSTLSCNESAGAPPPPGVPNVRSWEVACPAGNSAVLSATKTVTGNFVPGGTITYTITISNTGNAASADNAGNEFVDILPAQLTLNSANASAGTVTSDTPTRTVTWNGSVPAAGSVTISINATIANTLGTVSNQGTVNFDADGNGSNETAVTTDDPGAAGANNATVFAIGGSLLAVPLFDMWGKLLAAFAVLAMGLGFWAVRARN